MFHNKQALIGLYSGSSTANAAQLTNFSVTTTSGNILVDWGDGTSQTINSGVSVNHTFSCPDYSASNGLWNDINPCV